IRESAVVISSTMPSTKYSCSGSPLILAKGSTRNRRLVGQRQRCFGRSMRGNRDAIDVHRAGDVLYLLLGQILEREVELVAHLVAHDPADVNPAGLGQGFETGGDVDAVAKDVVIVDDDITDIDTDAELDAPIDGHSAVALGHLA